VILIELLKRLAEQDGYYSQYTAGQAAAEKLELLEKYREPEPPACLAQPEAVVAGFHLPTSQAQSPVDGGRVSTPCGRPCQVGVMYAASRDRPDRTVYMYLPCHAAEIRETMERDYRAGLLSIHEYAGLVELLRRQANRMPCTRQQEGAA